MVWVAVQNTGSRMAADHLGRNYRSKAFRQVFDA